MKTAIWWIRRDLRLADNQALSTAIEQAERVLPVFILDPGLLHSNWIGEKRLAFLFDGLRRLDDALRQRGSYLLIRSGLPFEVLTRLVAETGAEGIFAEADYSPYAKQRDRLMGTTLPIRFLPGLTVHPPDEIRKENGEPFLVFTPFSRAWLAKPVAGKTLAPPELIHTPPGLQSEPIPDSPTSISSVPFRAGESEAHRRLAAFIDNIIYRYGEDRNRMDLDGTSTLSPYLRFGMISARQVVLAAREADARAYDTPSRRSVETWINEIIWREFYIAVLHHFPHARTKAFRPAMRNIPWNNDTEDFAAWANGQTGFPVVDAAMRQLLSLGWMHNRARMIAASFLTKDLLVDWRWGERHFMQHLVDGDPAANNGGWQWTAGTGTDAAPYFRVFNPVLQGLKFDPAGAYVRRFVPELSRVPDKFIHTPWTMDAHLQNTVGCVIGKDYPAPIIDHSLARDRALQAYKNKNN